MATFHVSLLRGSSEPYASSFGTTYGILARAEGRLALHIAIDTGDGQGHLENIIANTVFAKKQAYKPALA
jgi:hypothetical protein